MHSEKNLSNEITLSIVFKYHIHQIRYMYIYIYIYRYILYSVSMWRLKFPVIHCLVIFKLPFNNSVLHIQ